MSITLDTAATTVISTKKKKELLVIQLVGNDSRRTLCHSPHPLFCFLFTTIPSTTNVFVSYLFMSYHIVLFTLVLRTPLWWVGHAEISAECRTDVTDCMRSLSPANSFSPTECKL